MNSTTKTKEYEEILKEALELSIEDKLWIIDEILKSLNKDEEASTQVVEIIE